MPWLLLVIVLALAVLMPKYGIAAQVRIYRAAMVRERTENALKHLLRQATDGHSASFRSLKGELGLSDRVLLALTERLEHEGFIHSDGTHLKLTPEGERVALHVVRAHRLWEVYLAEELGMPLDRVHVGSGTPGTSSQPAAARSLVGGDGTSGSRSARRSHSRGGRTDSRSAGHGRSPPGRSRRRRALSILKTNRRWPSHS